MAAHEESIYMVLQVLRYFCLADIPLHLVTDVLMTYL